MERKPNTLYVLTLSYGKDSIASIEACKQLGYPLDVAVHAEIWFNDEISADLPSMNEFKKHADKVIKERYGLDVIHVCATEKTVDGTEFTKKTYENQFYRTHLPTVKTSGRNYSVCEGCTYIYGFPCRKGAWCVGTLKQSALAKANILRHVLPTVQEQQNLSLDMTNEKINIVRYWGIATDEPKRIERHTKKKDVVLPLVDIGWEESYCREWCEENDLLSPIYKTATRGGCWFCHNQSIGQLRLLRKEHPELWCHLMRLDLDSPVTFRMDGHTVHDFDKRFQMEDEGLVPTDRRFKWEKIYENSDVQD